MSQLDVLNEDFRRLNGDSVNTPDVFDSLAADCQIEFCLAQQDAGGNPTTGIMRYNYGSNSYGAADIEAIIKPGYNMGSC